MPGAIVALALLLLNFGIVTAIILYSPTPRGGARRAPRSADRCFICSTRDLETTVHEYPVCASCTDEYFHALP